MLESDRLNAWLVQAASRLRLQRSLDDGVRALLAWAGLVMVGLMLRGFLGGPSSKAIAGILLFAALAVAVYLIWRLRRPYALAAAASQADANGHFADIIKSAHWFASNALDEPMAQAVTARAASLTSRTPVAGLFPLARPVGVPLLLALVLGDAALAYWLPARVQVQDYGDVAAVVTVPMSAALTESGTAATPAKTPAEIDRLERAAELVAGLPAGAARERLQKAFASGDMQRARLALSADDQAGADNGRKPVRQEADQMSDELAGSIMDRLREMLATQAAQADTGKDGGTATPRGPSGHLSGSADDPSSKEVEAPRRQAPQLSAGERALNLQLRAIAGTARGERAVGSADGEFQHAPGRSGGTTGGGAMGRRIGVSQAGAGGGDEPGRAETQPDSGVAPIQGPPTARLAVQLQRARLERQGAEEDRSGTADTFYAATQAQASQAAYVDVNQRRGPVSDQVVDQGGVPLALRAATRRYLVAQHARER